MYQDFGAREIKNSKKAQFQLFIPDENLNPNEYLGGSLPRVKDIYVVGDFQSKLGTGLRDWEEQSPITKMTKSEFNDSRKTPRGWLYSYTTPKLEDGFYQYKFYVTFENAESRYISDPCSRYGSPKDQNSGFTIGGQKTEVKAYPDRAHLKDLVIYEIMIEDFTKAYRDQKAPLDAIRDKLDYLATLGVNAIQFMPWTAWPGDFFSWGYNPFQYFSVAHQYTSRADGANPADKLIYLKQLIDACHDRNIQVIMDGVFNHAEANPPDKGFGYYWLYQDPSDSPYIGNFADHAFFKDLDYQNHCTLQFILDVCKYWIEVFKVDGIRFDNTAGFYKADDRGHGLSKLLSELRSYFSATGNKNFALILEHTWDYGAIDVTNKAGATSCWLDPYRSQARDYLANNRIQPSIMRMLNSAADFELGRVPTIYIENHDHSSILRYASIDGDRNRWYKTQPYAIALLTSPGAVLIHNGQEFGETWYIPEQDSDKDKRVISRPLDWNKAGDIPGQNLFNLYQQLIKIRKEHPGLRSANFYPGNWNESYQKPDKDGYGVDTEKQVVVYHRWGLDEAGKLERFYIVLNFSDSEQTISFHLPENDGWEDLLSGWKPPVYNNRLEVKVGSNWGHIFYKKP